MVDKKSFPKQHLNAKWGAHDEFVLSKQLTDMATMPQPFLSVLLTLSSHEPFEVPLKTPFNGTSEADKFRNAIYYADNCLGNYFAQAQQQSWFKKTLFIVVADHGHRLPADCDMSLPISKKITFLLYGGALKNSYKGKTFNKLVNQHDLPATLLTQLGISAKDFYWSTDAFNNDRKQFAYYANEQALGWITPEQNLLYSLTSKSIINNENRNSCYENIFEN